MTIAYQGVPGAFGHEACLRFRPDHEPVAEPSFAAVIAAVEERRAELGMLPLANSEAGETGARPLIERARVRIVDEPVLEVRMHLLGLPGARLEALRTVVSHPVALRQCARTLGALGLATREADNSAIAAARLSDPSEAALASSAAARIYGLLILKADVHDRSDNATRFAVLAPEDR